MAHILVALILLIACLYFFNTPTKKAPKTERKSATKEYLSNFKVYLCLKNKVFLYPPKEISIKNQYFPLNLSANNNLLPHKCIVARELNEDGICTECLNRCSFGCSNIINLGLSFSQFRHMSNDELKEYLKSVLSEEQFNSLF